MRLLGVAVGAWLCSEVFACPCSVERVPVFTSRDCLGSASEVSDPAFPELRFFAQIADLFVEEGRPPERRVADVLE